MRECGGHLFIRRGLSRLLDCLSIVHVVSLGLLVARALLRQPFRQRSPPPGTLACVTKVAGVFVGQALGASSSVKARGWSTGL